MKTARDDSIPFHRILVATDFGESSRRAVGLAARLAGSAHAQLSVVHTVETPAYVYSDTGYPSMSLFSAVSDSARHQLNDEVRALRRQGLAAEGILREGVAWEGILSAADAVKADLIVVGTHGHSGLTHLLLGSVAEKVVQKSAIPVLTVRGGLGALRVEQAEPEAQQRPLEEPQAGLH